MIADNSMLSSYCQCPLLYFLRYERHRASVFERSATQVGTLTHAFFASYINGENPTRALLDGLRALSESDFPSEERHVAQGKFQACCLELISNYPVLVDPNGTTLIMSPIKSPEGKLIGQTPRWIVRYPEIAFKLPILSGEKENELYDQASNHQFMGRMDCVVEDGNGQLFILELKTSGFANQPSWRHYWQIATQPKGYVWAAQLQTTKPIAGAIIIPIHTTTRQEKKQKFGTAKLQPEIEKRYTPQEIQQWQGETFDLMEQISFGSFPALGKYSGRCSSASFGQCDYLDFCLTGKEEMLLQSTVERVWSPLEPTEV